MSPTDIATAGTDMANAGDAAVLAELKDQLANLYQSLRTMRHAVNNNVAVIMATAEWSHRHPEQSEKLARACIERCPEIVMSIRAFSSAFDEVIKTSTRGLRQDQGA